MHLVHNSAVSAQLSYHTLSPESVSEKEVFFTLNCLTFSIISFNEISAALSPENKICKFVTKPIIYSCGLFSTEEY